MPRLTPRVLDFIAVYCADPHRNGADAYRRSHGSKADPQSCSNSAYKLLQRADIQAIVRRYDERLTENLILSANDLGRIWSENFTTDRNDLVEVRRIPCRFCHSPNGDPEFSRGEQRARRREHELKLRLMVAKMPDSVTTNAVEAIKAAMEFEELGGDGFDPRRPINSDCVECAGLGDEKVVIKDTTKLSPAARAIYDGAKVTKDGIEIKISSRDGALGMLAKAYGLGGDRPPPRPGDGPRDAIPTDPVEAARYYARLMDQSDE